jgi:hypothetical protein
MVKPYLVMMFAAASQIRYRMCLHHLIVRDRLARDACAMRWL